jgi:HEAT repeat protein
MKKSCLKVMVRMWGLWIMITVMITCGVGRDVSAQTDPVETYIRQLNTQGNQSDQISAAARSLGERRDRRAIAPLRKVVQKATGDVQAEALYALASLKDRSAFAPLLHRLRDHKGYDNNDGKIIRALGALGDERAIPPLVQILRRKGGYFREEAAEALGQLGSAQALDPLLEMLSTEQSNWIRASMIRGLWHFKDPRVLETLLAALHDTEDIQCEAIEALGCLGDQRAVLPLIPLLQYHNGYVRARTAIALGRLGDPRALMPLRALRQDHDAAACDAATWAIARIGKFTGTPVAIPSDAIPSPEQIDTAWHSGASDDSSAPHEYYAEDDSAALQRAEIAQLLGKAGDQRAVPRLLTMLHDHNYIVRSEAAWALDRLGDPQAVEALIAALRDQSEFVREPSAWALGKFGDRRAVAPLLNCLNDLATVQRAAIFALGCLQDRQAVMPLLFLLQSRDARIRADAAAALGRLGDQRALEHLSSLRQDGNDDVRKAAAQAVARIRRLNQ